jgi:hypothetical protein
MFLRKRGGGSLTARVESSGRDAVVYTFTDEGTEVPDDVGRALLGSYKTLAETTPEPVEASEPVEEEAPAPKKPVKESIKALSKKKVTLFGKKSTAGADDAT